VSTHNIHVKRKKLPDPTGKARLTVFLPEVTVVCSQTPFKALQRELDGYSYAKKVTFLF
jgi:hypothetical protein